MTKAVNNQPDKRDYESKFLKTISDGLRHAIRDHGPITKEQIGSAAKRIYSRLRGTKYESVIQDYSIQSDIEIGKDWLLYKDAATRIVARISDNDCLTCKHWDSDAVYAIAVELATNARTAASPAAPACPRCHDQDARECGRKMMLGSGVCACICHGAPTAPKEGLFEAKLLGFGEGDRIRLCEPCLRRAVDDHLVSFSCVLPAAPAPAENDSCSHWREGDSDNCVWCGDDLGPTTEADVSGPVAPKEEAELVDEVQYRMDQVVDAAVEWHQKGLEGEDSFEAAERLDAAINSLLELRSNLPVQNVGECFCGTELEAGLCPNGHDPITPPMEPSFTQFQEAYNQGIEDAKCAIRAESQGGGYWAATYINAIGRRCSPFRYTGLPPDADEATREQIVQAITDTQEARESHVQWAAHLRNSGHEECKGCTDHAAHIGDAKYHDEWIAKYDNIIAVLARTPFATTPSPDAAPKEEIGVDDQIIRWLLNQRKWYSEDIFRPWTLEEARRVHAEFPSAVDRIAAESARKLIDRIIADIREGKHNMYED